MSDDDITRYELIHAYLDGDLDADARKAFEARMTAEPELADAVQLEEELRMLVRYQRRLELKNMLRNLPVNEQIDQMPDSDDSATHPDSTKPPIDVKPKLPGGGIRPPFWRYAIRFGGVAAILIAAVVIFWPRGNGGVVDLRSLASENDVFGVSDMYADLSERGVSDVISKVDSVALVCDSLLGIQAYDAAYAKLDPNSSNDTILFMRGLALKGMGDAAKDSTVKVEKYHAAKSVFELELNRKGKLSFNPFGGNILWNLAMMDLWLEDADAAKDHLRKLIVCDCYKMPETLKLMETLDPEYDPKKK